MTYKHKVHNYERKVRIDFGGYGPNSLRIRGQKGGPNKHFSCFQTITCGKVYGLL